MPVSNKSPEDFAKELTDIVDLHPYGKITPLGSAAAIVITENSSVIKRIIELQEHVDIAPVKMVDESFQLERADVEEVAEALG